MSTDDKKKDIPEPVQALADAYLKEGTQHERVLELPKDTYEKHLPDGLTMPLVAKVDAYNTLVAAAQTLATGKFGMKVMAKDPKIDQVSSEMTAGKNTITAVFQREKMVPDGKGGQQVKYGVSSTKFTTHAVGSNRGALKIVRDRLSEMAEATAKK